MFNIFLLVNLQYYKNYIALHIHDPEYTTKPRIPQHLITRSDLLLIKPGVWWVAAPPFQLLSCACAVELMISGSRRWAAGIEFSFTQYAEYLSLKAIQSNQANTANCFGPASDALVFLYRLLFRGAPLICCCWDIIPLRTQARKFIKAESRSDTSKFWVI